MCRMVVIGALALAVGCGGGEEASTAGLDAAPDVAAADVPSQDVSQDVGGPEDVGPVCAPVPAAVTVSARLTVDPATGVLRDTLGREVVLRGINAGGRSKWAPFVPFPVADSIELPAFRDAARAFFGRLPAWGLDTVRLPFSWEALETSPGVFDNTYLARVEAMVDAAWETGLRVVLDFHQDVYASPYCGDGFPVWTIADLSPGAPRRDCPQWFTGYILDDGVKQAFDRVWDEASGMPTKLRGMWKVVATRFATHPGVIGFEIMNEPGWGTAVDIDAWKADVLTPFHAAMAAQLRGIAPKVLVFYDAPGIDALTTLPARNRPAGDGLVFAPHLYDAGLLAGNASTGHEPGPEIVALGAFRDEHKTPVLIGEFGVGGSPTPAGVAWLDGMMGALDEHRLSATLWELSQSGELWNDEDLSVLDAAGKERPVLDVYVRPWLRAVAGTASGFTWDRAAGEAEAKWTSDGGVSEVVVPARLFPDGPVGLVVEGEGACHTFDAARGELRVTAPAGVAVTVRFSAP